MDIDGKNIEPHSCSLAISGLVKAHHRPRPYCLPAPLWVHEPCPPATYPKAKMSIVKRVVPTVVVVYGLG